MAIGLLVTAFMAVAWTARHPAGQRGASRQAGAHQPTRPNIVVLLTDDQDAGSMGVMTHVQKELARHGTTFANSFASTPICCPSRATLLTGQYAHNHGVKTSTPPLGGFLKLNHSNTLAVWLQAAGYRTAHIGKHLNGYKPELARATIPPGWTEWYALVEPTSNYFNYVINANGELLLYRQSAQDYQTDVLASYAVRFIERVQAEGSVPFFLFLGFGAPHAEQRGRVIPAPRHTGRFAAQPLPMPPSFNEENVFDKPLWVRRLPRFSPKIVDVIAHAYRTRLEALLAVDEAVRDIVAALERTGLLASTVIIYTSDNGFFHGEHRIPTGKGPLYEEGIRVPLIIRMPGVATGHVLNHLVVNIDLAPTIAELTGAVPGLRVDGCSLVPLLGDPGTPWRTELLLESWLASASPEFVGIRTARYLYAESSLSGGVEEELYDLANDPFQLENLLRAGAKEDEPASVNHLRQRLQQLRTAAGAACVP